MVFKTEYDFITGFRKTSPPSCIRLFNDEDRIRYLEVFKGISITPNSPLKAEFMVKSDNVQVPIQPGGAMRGSYLTIYGSEDGVTYKWLFLVPKEYVYGKNEWTKHSTEMVIPSDVRFLRGLFAAAKGLTWFDDLKIYQDDVLIYANDFSNWNPVVGAGVGAVVVGATGYESTKRPEIAVPAALVGAGAGAGLGLFGPDAWSALIQGIAKEPLTTLAAGMAPVIAVGGAIAASELQKAHIFG